MAGFYTHIDALAGLLTEDEVVVAKDRASFLMRDLAVSMFPTASHQRRSPDSILKISREGTMAGG
jgi:hypothetical protein